MGPTGASSTRVGVLGGSFDPVHLGHVAIAEIVRETFGLGGVLFVPCAVPPHKPGRRLAAAEDRLRMLELALRDRPGLDASDVELERGGVSYTIDTLREVAASDTRVPVFILGMDALRELPTWHRWDELVDEFDIVAVDRPWRGEAARGPFEPRLAERVTPIAAAPGAGITALARPATAGRIFRVTLEPIPISASEIRARARRGLPLAGLVPPAVARYIQRSRLYLEEDTR
jgi:nicotinate-nucleotide adenylyltransferase